jgi:phage gpG-like protein
MNVKDFSAALRKLARVPAQIAPEVAKGIKKQVSRDFDAGQDPYGRKWQPLAESTKARGRHDPPLTDTRKGRKSIKVIPMAGAGVSITVGTNYMWRHQVGAGPPVRSFIPIGTLPKTYHAIWQKALDRQAKRILGGK